jgi:hypothetical protein
MGQIHVPLLTGGASGAGRWNGLSVRDRGEAVALLDGPLRLETARFWIEDLFEGFGTSVIFGDDFRKPAYCLSDVGTIQVGLPIHT